jgi:two-component system, chemotaxis family, response regulator PixG
MMMAAESSIIDSLSNQLEICIQMQFTGRLEVQAGTIQRWSLYFCMGRLLWAQGGEHGLRRWRRLLQQHCPQVNAQPTQLVEVQASRGKGYDLLLLWAKQQLITGEQAVNVIRSNVVEVFFDILQQEKTGQLRYTTDADDALEASLTLIHPRQVLTQSQQDWAAWTNAGLGNLSPNVAPVLRRPEQLEQQTSPQVYQTLVKVIDGDRTFRELAVVLRQEPLLLTRTLIAYVRKGLMELVKVADLMPARQVVNVRQGDSGLGRPPSSATVSEAPLITCIDDSPMEQRIIEQILTQAGYRFIGVQDPVQALPILLERRPDFIFLDLVMPIANGYEICTQIRRISQFKEVPVVILTGNDGIIDRVRAKMVGSTDFLGKPVEAERVLAIVKKYLQITSTISVESPMAGS